MSKKSRITGIDELIKKTDENRADEISLSRNRPIKEELTRVYFELPTTLKKKMNVYCAENDITIKDFITDAIKIRLDTKS
jgi:hypothetical protein